MCLSLVPTRVETIPKYKLTFGLVKKSRSCKFDSHNGEQKNLCSCFGTVYVDGKNSKRKKQLLFGKIKMGHDHLLKMRLLEKSARHDFIIARHCSSNNIFSCQLLENQISWKIICRTCISSSFTFCLKNINCLKIKWSTKVVENVNCSTQFIVKKMVYMYGS